MKGFEDTDYFLQPVEHTQRRYEALRAVVVERQTMQHAAQRFGISYGTLRNWHSEFRQAREAGLSPPFLSLRREADPLKTTPKAVRKSRSPMSVNCRWRRDAG
ncbi:MAG: helix-turn-helix domain-containing protein [Planctomycetota bacterium]|nr:helix-turn-helix domain-containing protein [Planctomycetota bacterium]